jgi:hypothetical protein
MKKILVTEAQLKRIIDDQLDKKSEGKHCKTCHKELGTSGYDVVSKKNSKGKSVSTYYCSSCFDKKYNKK